MSLLKAIKAQLGLSNTPANNFTITAEADNGTLKLARGNAGATTQDILTVDASGNVLVDGNNLNLFSAKSLATNGYQKLPSGLIIQWGVGSITNGTDGKSYTVTYPIAFPTSCRSVTAQITNSQNNSNYSGNLVTSLTGYTGWVFDRSGSGVVGGQIYWVAIGH